MRLTWCEVFKYVPVLIMAPATALALVLSLSSSALVDADDKIFELMRRCSFPGGGSFADTGESNFLDFTVELPINVPTAEDARSAFRAVQADVDSPLFWARWDDDEVDFEADGSSFVIVDPGVSYHMSDLAYDPENDCAKYALAMSSDEFPEGVSMLGDCLDVMYEYETRDGGFADLYGFFNCRFDGETPGLNQTEYCRAVSDVWSHSDPGVAVCLMEHWSDGQHEQCRNGDDRTWG